MGAARGDAAMRIEFTGGSSKTLTLDMSSTTACSASSIDCPRVYLVKSDHSANAMKITKCAFFRHGDYSTHVMTYTFINVGQQFPYVVKDDHDHSRALVPPGATRECMCYCKDTCTTSTKSKLYCSHNSPSTGISR